MPARQFAEPAADGRRGQGRQAINDHHANRQLRLTDRERQVLSDLTAWRVARLDDLNAPRHAVRHLERAGLITVNRQHGATDTYLAATREGAWVARRHIAVERDQGYLAGIRKDRAAELRHDSAVYRSSLNERRKAERDEKARLVRVLLDDELRRRYTNACAIHRRRVNRELDARELQDLASQFDLSRDPDTDRVLYPDAQLTFERPDGSRYTVGVEVVTANYHSSDLRAKQGAGFALYAPSQGEQLRCGGITLESDDLWNL